jgi:hypothetical protein
VHSIEQHIDLIWYEVTDDTCEIRAFGPSKIMGAGGVALPVGHEVDRWISLTLVGLKARRELTTGGYDPRVWGRN